MNRIMVNTLLVAFLTTKQVVREPDHVYIPDILKGYSN